MKPLSLIGNVGMEERQEAMRLRDIELKEANLNYQLRLAELLGRHPDTPPEYRYLGPPSDPYAAQTVYMRSDDDDATDFVVALFSPIDALPAVAAWLEANGGHNLTLGVHAFIELKYVPQMDSVEFRGKSTDSPEAEFTPVPPADPTAPAPIPIADVPEPDEQPDAEPLPVVAPAAPGY